MIYRFDGYELDTARLEVRLDGKALAVEPQVFDVLAHLVAHRDRVVPKEELLDSVWGDRFVSESALTSRIKAARRLIGDDGATQRSIRTVHGRGYRFVADVREGVPSASPPPSRGRPTSTPLPEPVAPSADQRANEQRIQFCKTPDGVRLAYASVGDGPPLVKAANWLSHLDYDWESPLWGHWWRELSVRHRLVRYDERGCGLSDWDVDDFSLETWVTDLETVVDAAGIERFPLLGVSQGGPVAMTYAARHPERVRALILYGTYAQGRLARARTPTGPRRSPPEPAARPPRLGSRRPRLPQGVRHAVHAERDRRAVGPLRGAAAEDHRRRPMRSASWRRSSRSTSSTSRPNWPSRRSSSTPATISGRRSKRGVGWRRWSPSSRFVTLESSNHLLLEDEPAWPRFLDAVESFLDEHS